MLSDGNNSRIFILLLHFASDGLITGLAVFLLNRKKYSIIEKQMILLWYLKVYLYPYINLCLVSQYNLSKSIFIAPAKTLLRIIKYIVHGDYFLYLKV